MKKLITFLGSLFKTPAASASGFSVGQVWHCQTREHEAGSKLSVVQIDTLKGHEIIHISIEGLRISSPHAASSYSESVSHLPIGPTALKASVTQLSAQTDDLPDYKEGYQIWREAFDSDDAGFFTIPVAECVSYLEQAINQ
jgi:hypothetical protein